MGNASTGLSDITRIARNSSVYLAFQASGYVLGFIATILLARAISPADYGVYSFLFSILSMSGLLVTIFGINTSLVYHIARYRAEGKAEQIAYILRFSILFVLALAIVTVLAIFFLSDYIAGSFLKPEYAPLIRIICIAIPLTYISGRISAVLQGYEKIPYSGFIDFLLAFSRLVFILLLIYFSLLRLTNLAYMVVAIYFIQLLASLIFLRKIRLKKPLKIDLKPFVSFGFKIGGGEIAYTLNESAPLWLTGYFLNPDSLGLYSMAYTIAALMLFIPVAIRTAFSPAFTYRYSKDVEEARNLFHNILRTALVIAVPALFCIIFLIDPFVTYFLPKYVASLPAMKIISTGFSLMIFTIIFTAVIQGIGKPLYSTVIGLTRLIAFLVLSIFLIPSLGIEGTGVSILLSIAASFTVAIVLVHRSMRVSFSRLKIKNVLVPAIVLAAIFYGFSRISDSIPATVGVIIIGLIVYILLMIVFKVIKMDEIKAGLSFLPVFNRQGGKVNR